MKKHRVVITGMEIVSSLGNNLEVFWEKAFQGESGIKRIEAYDPSQYPTQIGGEITNFALGESLQFNNKHYPKVAEYALYCTHHALRRAGLLVKELNEAGIYIGTSLGGTPELEMAYKSFYQESWKKIPALSVIKGMPNSVANHMAIAFGIQGPNSTTSNACVSSAEAISNAYQQITHGCLKLAVCGGTESLLWESIMAAWCKLRIMSTNNEEPTKACQPFNKTRDGMVMADGAGILILEELEQAKARGATIYAEIIGCGASCDAYHVTVPNTKGQVRAIHKALDDARLSLEDVHSISAHGTGTKLNDLIETQTIKTVFQEKAYSLPISAHKSMLGHSIGAAGAIQIIATTLSLQKNIVLPTINLNEPDPNCDLDYVANVARPKSIDIALSNHFAFGGANFAFLLQKFI